MLVGENLWSEIRVENRLDRRGKEDIFEKQRWFLETGLLGLDDSFFH